MNNERRKTVAEIIDKLVGLGTEIEGVKEEEQDSLDSMPDSLRDGEKGQRAQEVIDQLSTAHDDLETAVQSLEDAKG